MKNSRPGCATPNVSRKANCHPNPPPGSTPQAAAAAKDDAKKRDGGVVGALKAAYNKIVASTPAPNATPASSAAMADKKDQARKLSDELK